MINLQLKILKCWLLLKNNGLLHRTTAATRLRFASSKLGLATSCIRGTQAKFAPPSTNARPPTSHLSALILSPDLHPADASDFSPSVARLGLGVVVTTNTKATWVVWTYGFGLGITPCVTLQKSESHDATGLERCPKLPSDYQQIPS